MPNESFAFKQFTIKQDKCAMKVGTDAVLLGAWTQVRDEQHILDIGTGTGVIALMLAQKSNAKIAAIELDEKAVEQAKENVLSSPWSEQINIHHASLQDFAENTQEQYDISVSNPPYFQHSSKAFEEARSKARHSESLPFKELIKGINKLLKPKGKLFVIFPPTEGEEFREIAREYNLRLSQLTRVKSKINSEKERRMLMQFERDRKSFSENTIAIEKEDRHQYTDEYIALTKDYYLNF